MPPAWYKIFCFLFGHDFDYDAMYYYWPVCESCGKEFQENGCEQNGLIVFGIIGWPIHKAKQSFKLRWHVWGWKMFFSKCYSCNKILTFRKKVGRGYCSKKCQEEDLPF